MKSISWGQLIFIAVCGCIIYLYAHPNEAVTKSAAQASLLSQMGRYQVVSNEYGAFRTDTQTGETWVWKKVMNPYFLQATSNQNLTVEYRKFLFEMARNNNDGYWEPAPEFDNMQAANSYGASLMISYLATKK